MTTPDPEALEPLRNHVEDAWHRFLDVYEGLRPELYRYCRHLTRSAFEADDLVQDAMIRGFVTLGRMAEPPARPRAWLFRVASNLWIDRGRASAAALTSPPGTVAAPAQPRALREAAGTILALLAPQERAAVVLKEAFGFSLEEIAEALSTTPGTVRSALHRGRGKLAEPPDEPPPPPRPQALDAFCAAFNAGDLERLTGLLLETAEIEVVRVHTEYGPEAARRGVFQGMLFGPRRLADPAQLPPGVDPAHVVGILPAVPRCEARLYRGEWLAVLWYAHADGEAVRGLVRLEAEGDRLARVRNYFYTPDVIEEVCRELSLPFRSSGPRYWKPAS